MKQPVFRFSDERLTDAPYAVIESALIRMERPKAFSPWSGLASPGMALGWVEDSIEGPKEEEGLLRLRWTATYWGTREEGCLTVDPSGDKVHLKLEGKCRGWFVIGSIGLLSWGASRSIDRFVESL
ncbi:MAG TPA: hypothetical protein VJ463_05505 [Geothrix sp.]|nr:hypothetical protein [Geothrix sp.]